MSRLLLIDPAEAAAHGLPPVRVSADLGDAPLFPWLYPDASTYATLSGPPGGPLFFRIHPLMEPMETAAVLAARLTEWNLGDPHFTLGPAAAIELRGVSRLARLYFTGHSHAACASCAVVIPAPPNGASVAGLLLIFGHGGTPEQVADCAQIAGCDALAPILKSLTWDLAVDSAPIAAPTEAEPIEEPTPPPPPPVREPREVPPLRAPQQQSSPAALLRFVEEIRSTMKAMNAWWDVLPDGAAFAAWTPLQQQLWSLQATLQAIEPSMQQALQIAPQEPVFGIVEMLANWQGMLAQTPGGAELAALLGRGPQA